MVIRNIDFVEADDILNYRPVIEYVEPEQEPGEYGTGDGDAPMTIEDTRKETEDVIAGYKAVEELAKISKDRINSRIKAAGGVSIQMDPVKDSPLIAAIKRQFPKEDGSRITDDMYLECLRRMRESAPDAPSVQQVDIQEALKDPLRTNFGGSENPAGTNRADIAALVDIVEPVDVEKFKDSMITQMIKTVLDVLPF